MNPRFFPSPKQAWQDASLGHHSSFLPLCSVLSQIMLPIVPSPAYTNYPVTFFLYLFHLGHTFLDILNTYAIIIHLLTAFGFKVPYLLST
jgi:hypothetical protein